MRREADLPEGVDVVLERQALLGAGEQREVDRLRQLLLRAPLREVILGRRWSITLWPTAAAAQQAGMGTREFEDFVTRALFLDPSMALSHWILGRRQWERGDLARARLSLTRPSLAEPDRALYVADRAQAAAALGDWDEARKAWVAVRARSAQDLRFVPGPADADSASALSLPFSTSFHGPIYSFVAGSLMLVSLTMAGEIIAAGK